MGCLGPCSALGIFPCKSSLPRRQPWCVCVTSAGEWEPPQGDCLESTFSACGNGSLEGETGIKAGVWDERVRFTLPAHRHYC